MASLRSDSCASSTKSWAHSPTKPLMSLDMRTLPFSAPASAVSARAAHAIWSGAPEPQEQYVAIDGILRSRKISAHASPAPPMRSKLSPIPIQIRAKFCAADKVTRPKTYGSYTLTRMESGSTAFGMPRWEPPAKVPGKQRRQQLRTIPIHTSKANSDPLHRFRQTATSAHVLPHWMINHRPSPSPTRPHLLRGNRRLTA